MTSADHTRDNLYEALSAQSEFEVRLRASSGTATSDQLSENSKSINIIIDKLQKFVDHSKEVPILWNEVSKLLSWLLNNCIECTFQVHSSYVLEVSTIILSLSERGEPVCSSVFNKCAAQLLHLTLSRSTSAVEQEVLLTAVTNLCLFSTSSNIADVFKSLSRSLDLLAKKIFTVPIESQLCIFIILSISLNNKADACKKSAVWFKKWPALAQAFPMYYSTKVEKLRNKNAGLFVEKILQVNEATNAKREQEQQSQVQLSYTTQNLSSSIEEISVLRDREEEILSPQKSRNKKNLSSSEKCFKNSKTISSSDEEEGIFPSRKQISETKSFNSVKSSRKTKETLSSSGSKRFLTSQKTREKTKNSGSVKLLRKQKRILSSEEEDTFPSRKPTSERKSFNSVKSSKKTKETPTCNRGKGFPTCQKTREKTKNSGSVKLLRKQKRILSSDEDEDFFCNKKSGEKSKLTDSKNWKKILISSDEDDVFFTATKTGKKTKLSGSIEFSKKEKERLEWISDEDESIVPTTREDKTTLGSVKLPKEGYHLPPHRNLPLCVSTFIKQSSPSSNRWSSFRQGLK